jgi:hypothetical protein
MFMTQADLLNRLGRIYAAVKASTEFDMTKLPAKILPGGGTVGFWQDFTGNRSEHDIENAAQDVIHNIASLKGHLKRWAVANKKDKTRVDAAFNKSAELQIIEDLWNNDKHGYPPRNEGCSRKAPKLRNIRSLMKLTTQAKIGSFVTLTLGPGGVPNIKGDGSAYAVITGDVVDKDGNMLGDLFNIEKGAVEAWESLLTDYGIPCATAK